VFGVPFTVDAGSKHELVLELRGDGGQLQGTVIDRARRKVPNVSVVLVPPDHRREDPAAYLSTTTDARGEFAIERIRPDSYTVLAFSKRVEFGELRNPAFIGRYVSSGRRLIVDKGKKVRAYLEPVPLQ
jgi:hypothetical protein